MISKAKARKRKRKRKRARGKVELLIADAEFILRLSHSMLLSRLSLFAL
jgi:hypothetical protein